MYKEEEKIYQDLIHDFLGQEQLLAKVAILPREYN
jgi:hypothetical protein